MLSRKDAAVYQRENASTHYSTVVDSPSHKGTDTSYAKNLLWMVFANSRGGHNRIRMIMALRKSPFNAHQLAKKLDLNYRAIQHHIGVLEKNNLVSHVGEQYGTVYYLSNLIEANMAIFEELAAGLQRSK
jgi:DNA-binding transcriptional ArsR family regulator